MEPTRAASYGKGPQFYRSGEQFFKDTSEKERVEEEKKLMNGNLRYAQIQAEKLEKELIDKSITHAKHIGDLKFQIAMAEAEIQGLEMN